MFAASMEAPSYGASKLPFAIRHRPTVYATKFASCVGYPLRYSGSSFLSARWVTFAIISVFPDRAQD
jgi:hypothetical protein